MKFYFLNWVQLSCDFGKVVPNDTTQGYFHPYTLLLSKVLISTCLNHPKFNKFCICISFLHHIFVWIFYFNWKHEELTKDSECVQYIDLWFISKPCDLQPHAIDTCYCHMLVTHPKSKCIVLFFNPHITKDIHVDSIQSLFQNCLEILHRFIIVPPSSCPTFVNKMISALKMIKLELVHLIFKLKNNS
jgi:hypothetical protein